MKVLVCGGRTFTDYDLVCKVLDHLNAKYMIEEVIEGGQRHWEGNRCIGGADYLGFKWAGTHHVKKTTVKAEWYNLTLLPVLIGKDRNGNDYNKLAGFNRNAKMLEEHEPDLVVAFPGGSGTADMVRKARAAGVRVMEVATDWKPDSVPEAA